MAQGCLSTADLLALSGYDRVGDLRRSLDDQHVGYFLGKGGAPWTTVDLLNAAKGLKPANDPPAPIGAEIL